VDFVLKLTLTFLVFMTLTACSPKFDWRDTRDGISPYTVLMPAKPSALSRDIQIGAQTVTMHMTASQIDHVKFAVGAADMGDPAVAQQTLAVIRTKLVDNIAGHLTQDRMSVAQVDGKPVFVNEFEAASTEPTGVSIRMQGRLVARGGWVFQVLVVGPDKELNREVVDTFLTSFKPV